MPIKFPIEPQGTTIIQPDPIKLKRGDYNPYPGHPLMVIMEMLFYYEGNIKEAFEKSDHNNSKAIGNSYLHGAGGNVHEGISILYKYLRGEYTLEMVWGMSNRYWIRCITGQSPSSADKVLVSGMIMANSFWPLIESKLKELQSDLAT